MILRRYSFILLLLTLTSLCHCQTSRIVDIYVSPNPNKPASSGEPGSIENPFSELSDAFYSIPKYSRNRIQVTIYVAPTIETYFLNKFTFTFPSTNSDTLRLSNWEDAPFCQNNQSRCQAKPTIDLKDSYLYLLAVGQLNMTGFTIKSRNSNIEVEWPKTMILKGLSFSDIETTKPFFSVRDSSIVNLAGLEIGSSKLGSILEYSRTMKEVIPQISLQNTTIRRNIDMNELFTGIAMFSFDTAIDAEKQGRIEINEIKFKDEGLAQNFMKIRGFEDVKIANLKIGESLITLDNTNSYLDIQGAKTVELKGIHIEKSQIQGGKPSLALINLQEVKDLGVREFNIMSNLITITPKKALNIMSVSQIVKMQVQNFSFVENTLDGNLKVFKVGQLVASNQEGQVPALDLDISNITIKDNTNKESSSRFSFLTLQGLALRTFNLDKIDFINNKLSDRVFSLQVSPLTDLLQQPTQLSLKNINIKENHDASDINFLYFLPVDNDLCLENCVQIVEPYTLNIEGLAVENNNFYKGRSNLWSSEDSLFQIRQTQVMIKNLKMLNCSFSSYNFINLDQKPSTFILSSSEIKNTTLKSSQFVATNYLNKYSYFLDDEKKQTIPFYRYSLISDCLFSDLELSSSSGLLNLNNGFFILQDNLFNDVTLSEASILINLDLSCWKQRSSNMLAAEYSRDMEIERLTLGDNKAAWEIFNRSLSSIESVQYFSRVLKNEFENIVLSSSKLFSLSGFGFNQSYILFKETDFLGVSSYDENPIINIDNFNKLMINSNKFYRVKGCEEIFSLSRSANPTTTSALIIQDNFNEGIEVASFLQYKGKSLKDMEFINNTFLGSKFEVSLVSITAGIVSGNWSVSNNKIHSIDFSFDENKVHGERFGLVHLFAVDALKETRTLFLENNSFERITIYMKNRRPTPTSVNFLYLNTPQDAKLKNNSIVKIYNLDQGNLIYTLNLLSFTLKNSTLEDCSASSSTGIVALSAEKVEVSNCSFKRLMNSDMFGLFYMKIYLDQHTVKFNNTTFDTLSHQSTVGGLISIRTTDPSDKSFTVGVEEDVVLPKLDLEISNCYLNEIVGGPVLQLSNLECSTCKVSSNNFSLSEKSSKYLVELVEGVSGLCQIRNPNVSVKAGNNTLLKATNFRGSVIVEDFEYKENETPFYIAHLDSGEFTLKNLIYQDVKLTTTPVIRVVPSVETDFSYVSRAPPRVNLENCSFYWIENLRSKFTTTSFSLDDIFTWISLLSMKLWEDAVQIRGMLRYEYNTTSKYWSPSVIFSGMPVMLKIRGCDFSGIRKTPSLLFASSTDIPNQGRNSSIWIEDSEFTSLSHYSGAALTVLPTAYSPKIDVVNSSFRENNGFVAGSLLIYDSKLTINNSEFIRNYAVSTGSVMMLGGTTQKEFIQNHLKLENNVAYDMQPISYEATDYKLSFTWQDEQGEKEISQILENGSVLDVSNLEFLRGNLNLEFIDGRGKPAPDYSGIGVGKATILISNHDQTKLPKKFTVTALQSAAEGAAGATLPLNNVLIGGVADEKIPITVRFSSERIVNVEKKFVVKFRGCRAGEFNITSSYICQECIAPTFSINASHPCTNCPANALCPKQSKVCPREGYWNKDSTSELVFKCREDQIGRCSNETSCQSCKWGYTGPLCEACDFDNSFVEIGYLKCGLCQDPAKSLKYSILFGLLYFIYQVFSIYSIYNANKGLNANQNDYLATRKIERSYYLKSLLTYTQIMSILYINSSQIYKMAGLTSQLGNPSSLIVYGTQCSLKALGISPKEFLYYQTLIIVLTPIVEFVGLALVMLIWRSFSKQLPVKKMLTTALIYFMLSHQPGIINNLTQFLSCTTLKDLEWDYVGSHPYWHCNDSGYMNIADYVVKPSLIVWCILTPMLLGALLISKKDSLKSEDSSAMLGILYADLNLENYYWGIVLMVLKLALSFLVYGLERDTKVQICVSLILLWGYQSLVRLKKPYKNKNFNKFEILLINLLMFNIVVTTYGLNPSEESSIASSISLIASGIFNGGFLLLVVFKILSLTILNLLAMVEKGVFKRRITRRELSLLQEQEENTLSEIDQGDNKNLVL